MNLLFEQLKCLSLFKQSGGSQPPPCLQPTAITAISPTNPPREGEGRQPEAHVSSRPLPGGPVDALAQSSLQLLRSLNLNPSNGSVLSSSDSDAVLDAGINEVFLEEGAPNPGEQADSEDCEASQTDLDAPLADPNPRPKAETAAESPSPVKNSVTKEVRLDIRTRPSKSVELDKTEGKYNALADAWSCTIAPNVGSTVRFSF